MSKLKLVYVRKSRENLRYYLFKLERKNLRVIVSRISKNQCHINVDNGGDWITRELRNELIQAITKREEHVAFRLRVGSEAPT